ncbi:hypothetical protein ABK905_05695 [Acerihabitans sp. KWT182]|uniref:Uncharacterized protein n=1 Tax=Acerihabitans sp. KWT182 TaxID=3157919 RepID=A0AAU7QFF0_9GAMM
MPILPFFFAFFFTFP